MAIDVIVVGGGLGGSAIAAQLAQCGHDVLVLERETQFKDRVRGENMLPWGAAAARRLGIVESLEKAGAHRPTAFTQHTMGQSSPPRDLRATTPEGDVSINIYHPAMQEALLERAVALGAKVLRGATVTNVEAGNPPRVTFEHQGQTRTESPRLVIGADGRASQVRSWAGFEVNRNPEVLTIAGTLLENTEIPVDSVHLAFGPGFATFLAPLGPTTTRAYFIYPGIAGKRGLTGKAKASEFLDACRATLIPDSWLASATSAGPLAEFEGADRWTTSAVREGVALIGDAAAASDPSWGCGLSKTVTDAEHLSRALCETSDWASALARYAAEHDEYASTLRKVLGWMTELAWTPGPEADERRARVFPRMAQQPEIFPDPIGLGPFGPSDEQARRYTLGID